MNWNTPICLLVHFICYEIFNPVVVVLFRICTIVSNSTNNFVLIRGKYIHRQFNLVICYHILYGYIIHIVYDLRLCWSILFLYMKGGFNRIIEMNYLLALHTRRDEII